MFANVLRTQARNALASCRPRVSMTSVVAQLVARRPAQAFLTVSRPLSTSRMVRNDFETNNFSRPAPLNKEPTDTIYIGNLPFSVQEQDIREKFEVYGPIHSLRLGEYHHLLVCISLSLMWKNLSIQTRRLGSWVCSYTVLQ